MNLLSRHNELLEHIILHGYRQIGWKKFVELVVSTIKAPSNLQNISIAENSSIELSCQIVIIMVILTIARAKSNTNAIPSYWYFA